MPVCCNFEKLRHNLEIPLKDNYPEGDFKKQALKSIVYIVKIVLWSNALYIIVSIIMNGFGFDFHQFFYF